MERQFPKNVRQIGNVGDEPKIYVEDYVDIYLNQQEQQTEETPVGIILIGEILKLEGQDVVCISGAMGIRDIRMNGTEIVLEKETFKRLEEERKKYFPSGEAVGWCLIENDRRRGIRPGLRNGDFHPKVARKGPFGPGRAVFLQICDKRSGADPVKL